MSSWKMKAEGGTRAADRDEIRRALSVLVEPEQRFELRGLPSGRSRICRGSDLDAAVEAAWELSDGQVYYTLNPLRPGMDRPARAGDVLAYRWLLIDSDPERPADTSATDAEKASAVDQCCRIADHLAGLGWPDPVWIDSGNGGHLLYRVDLPAEKLSQQILKGVMAALGDLFDDDRAKVDRKVHNASRVSKLPGTWARKGVHTDDRPHRMARLVSVPPTIGVVPMELLRELAGGGADTNAKGGLHGDTAPPPPANGHVNGHAPNPWATRATARSLDGYVKSAVVAECNRVAMTGQGDRNNALNTAAFNLGTMADWPEMEISDAKLALYAAAKAAGLEEQETIKTIASGWDAGAAKGRTRPADGVNGKSGHGPTPAGKPPDPNRRLIIWAKDVTPRKVDWLWPGRIPVGKATTFAGQTGMGKTFAVCDLAARISRGAEIPFAGGECFRQGKVLIISAEDDADDTIVPRLIDLDADLSQIAFLSPSAEADFNLGALELLNNSLDQMAGDVRMVAIDPPTSFMGGVDDHKNTELRGLMAPLRRWTIERQVALIFVTHINKGGSGNVDAMARVMGGAAWVQAVRAAHMFLADPDAKGKSLFLPLKVNNAKPPTGLGYQIKEGPDGRVVIEWQCEVDTSPEDALSRTPKKSRGVCAVEWLVERFRERREWPSEELKQAAAVFGLSKNALFSPEVNGLSPQFIRKKRRVDSNGEPAWWWLAQEGWPPDQAIGNLGNLGNVDTQTVGGQQESKIPDARDGPGILEPLKGDRDEDASKSPNIPNIPKIPIGDEPGFLPGKLETRPPGYKDAWNYNWGKGKPPE